MEAEIYVALLVLLHRQSSTFMASTKENESDHHQCSEGFLSSKYREEMRRADILRDTERPPRISSKYS